MDSRIDIQQILPVQLFAPPACSVQGNRKFKRPETPAEYARVCPNPILR